MTDEQDFRQITAETAGKDLLGALIQEIKLMPDVWQMMTKTKQDDVIDRLRKRVEDNVRMVVYTLAAEGRIVVSGDLEQITIKDGVKAVVKFGTSAANLHNLYDSNGKGVLVVVANAADYTQGMNEVQGEEDQRSMEFGTEYEENDGGGMDDENTSDAEVLAIEHVDEEIVDQGETA